MLVRQDHFLISVRLSSDGSTEPEEELISQVLAALLIRLRGSS